MGKIIGWVIVIAVIWSLFSSLGKYEGETAEYWYNVYDEASGEADELRGEVDGLRDALWQANDNIETANYMIKKAKRNSGGSYDEMEYALDKLNTVDTVDEP